MYKIVNDWSVWIQDTGPRGSLKSWFLHIYTDREQHAELVSGAYEPQ